MRVLANDGISTLGKQTLEEAGFEVYTETVAQEQLTDFITQHQIEILLVRSATQARKELIDGCPSLKIIGRGGVGMDNIDVDYAKQMGLHVINTPAASSRSVAELTLAHLFTMVRFLHDANRNMPLEGETKFKELKKRYSKGTELMGKTLGVVGFGRIAIETIKLAIGVGMKVVVVDKHEAKKTISLDFFDGQQVHFTIQAKKNIHEMLKQADFITLHVPAQAKPIIGREELAMVKQGVGLVNTSRGGVIDEEALIEAIESEKVKYAALDVFANEPEPSMNLLMNPELSLSPHIGGATQEAQDRIGTELAEQIIAYYKKVNA